MTLLLHKKKLKHGICMYQIAKISNWITNRRRNLFMVLSIAAVHIFLATKNVLEFVILEFLFLFLSLQLKRVGPMFVYFPVGNKLSMNLEDVSMFQQYDYNKKEDKDKIKQILIEECVKGLQKTKIRKFSFHTHQWMLDSVFTHPNVLKKYDIVCKKAGTSKHTLDILLISSGKKTNNMKYEKQNYKVTMKLKSK